MAVSRVTREDLVEQSVIVWLREQLFTVRQYPAAQVELVEAFDEDRFEGPLTKNFVAIGFNFDDGGEPAELGSDLLRRTYTIEVWVIGRSYDEGRNLANAARDSLQSQGTIPLLDIRQAGAPVVDYLIVDPARAQRQPVPEPKPWQQFLFIVQAPVVDEYHSSSW